MWLSGSEAGRPTRLGAARLDGRAGRASRSKKGATFDGLGQPSGRPRPRIFSRIPEVGWSSFGLGTYHSVSLPLSPVLPPPLPPSFANPTLPSRPSRSRSRAGPRKGRVKGRAAGSCSLLLAAPRRAENRSRETIGRRRDGERSPNEFSEAAGCSRSALSDARVSRY